MNQIICAGTASCASAQNAYQLVSDGYSDWFGGAIVGWLRCRVVMIGWPMLNPRPRTPQSCNGEIFLFLVLVIVYQLWDEADRDWFRFEGFIGLWKLSAVNPTIPVILIKLYWANNNNNPWRLIFRNPGMQGINGRYLLLSKQAPFLTLFRIGRRSAKNHVM